MVFVIQIRKTNCNQLYSFGREVIFKYHKQISDTKFGYRKILALQKPNSKLQYIHSQSNHTQSIKRKQLPAMIEKRLSAISYDQKEFVKAVPSYNEALKKSTYKHNLQFQQPFNNSRQKSRKCNFIWFNLPFSNNVSTNIGNKFLKLLDEHLSPTHKLRPICNRSTIKISYSFMSNMASIIKSHITKIGKPATKERDPTPNKTCNCRNPANCPLNGNCLKESLIHEANVTSRNQESSYFGSCSTDFKKCYNNHTATFRHRNKAAHTELSKCIWRHKKKGHSFNI